MPPPQRNARLYRAVVETGFASAVSGAMGGSASEEFLGVAPTGEDTYVACTSCDYAANTEAVELQAAPEQDPAAQPALELGPGEVVPDGDDRGVPVQGHRLAGPEPGLLVGLQVVDHALPGGHQIRIVVHRTFPLSSLARDQGRADREDPPGHV